MDLSFSRERYKLEFKKLIIRPKLNLILEFYIKEKILIIHKIRIL